MATATARLGPYTFVVDPAKVEWSFDMKISQRKSLAGRVIQVYGTDLGDMTVEVMFGRGDVRRGDTAAWQAAERFRSQMEDLVEQTSIDRGAPLRFTLPSKKWAFDVYVKAITPMREANDNIRPTYTVTLFIVEDLTKTVTKGIKDKYIERLMAGVGWAQSEYNGPEVGTLAATLAPHGGSVHEWYKAEFLAQWNESVGNAGGGGGGGIPEGPAGLAAYLFGLRTVESSDNYTAQNPYSTASGAYQYIDSTWANYKGYRRAKDAPPAVQDERVGKDAMAAYDKYGTWEAHATIHLTGSYVAPTDPKYNQVPGHPSNPTVRQYVEKVMRAAAQYGGGAGGGGGNLAAVLAEARKWIGTPYAFGGGTLTGPSLGHGTGAGISGFDCSSLCRIAYYQGNGYELPRDSRQQYQRTKGKSVDDTNRSAWLPGDLIFWSRGGAASIYHVALYSGNGQMIEAPKPGGRVQEVAVWGSPYAVTRL